MHYSSDVEAVDALVAKYDLLKKEIAKVIVGQDEVIRNLLISIFCKGHCLLVGVPGLAKTLMVNTLSKVLGLSYNRIQFTSDLMPSDIINAEILDENRKFRFIKGPVFVLATQNPIEHEGTYPLPEAQLDRFMFNIWLDYPPFEEEISIVKNTTSNLVVQPEIVLNRDEILFFQDLILKIPVPENVFRFAVELVSKTRPGTDAADPWANNYLTWGAGPRASQYLIFGAKCHAVFNGKYSPDIEDVRAVATSVLRHRIVRNYKAEAEGISVDDIIRRFIA